MSFFQELSDKIKLTFADAQQNNDAGTYQRLATVFSEYEGELREYIQEITKGQISKIIEKLDNRQDINEEEMAFIKLWIVGDADYYTQMENNFKDWLMELSRIVTQIDRTAAQQDIDFGTASRLRAVIEDGKRVIYDISFFLEKKEREEKFADATMELDNEEKDLLAKLLRSKIASKEI